VISNLAKEIQQDMYTSKSASLKFCHKSSLKVSALEKELSKAISNQVNDAHKTLDPV